LVCDFQGTDSNGLQPAQQSLDFAFFAFDSPFMGELSTAPPPRAFLSTLARRFIA
jgi:hypothetical protein